MMMKIKYLSLATVASLAMVITSCSNDDFASSASGQGKIQLALTVDTSINSRAFADDGVVTVDDLSFRLTDSEGNVKEYSSVSRLEAATLAIGTYTLEAYFGDETNEGFTTPYYYGISENVKIEDDETTMVSLTAKMANSQIKINYTESLEAYLTSYTAEIATESGNNIDYPSEATDNFYTKAGKVDVYLRLEKPNGVTGRVHAATFTTKPATCHNLTIGMDTEVEKASLVVTFSDDPEETHTNVIDLSDELLNATAPVVTAEGFTDGETIEFVTGTSHADALNFVTIARGGLSKVTLNTTTNSSYLSKDWPESLELINLTEDQQATYKALGLDAKGVWKNPDQMAIIDLSGLVKSVRLPEGSDKGTIEFTLTVEDNLGQTNTETPKLIFSATRAVLSLSAPFEVLYDDTELTIQAKFNGDINNLSYTYLNIRGTWTSVTPTTISNNGDGTYDVTLPKEDDITVTTDGNTTITIKAEDESDSSVTDQVVITPGPAITYTNNNIWATKADVYVWNGSKYYNSGITTGYHSTDGTNWTEVAVTDLGEAPTGQHLYRITGLTPGTTNYIKLNHPENSSKELNPVAVTTEEATQVYNQAMEYWWRVKGDTEYWWIDYPGETTDTPWGTNNLLTTSEGGSSTSWANTNRNGCSYNAYSGTQKTEDKHSGTYAAYIATEGWGAGNNAVGEGNFITPMKMAYGDPGLLHLGENRTKRPTGYTDCEGPIDTDDLNCGISFDSRPSSLSFFYKYTARNSEDKGFVEIWIQGEGSVQGGGVDYKVHKTLDLDPKTGYEEININLEDDYPVNASRGAKLYIRFQSTHDQKFLSSGKSNYHLPEYANTTDERYYGSELYIDDITLNY